MFRTLDNVLCKQLSIIGVEGCSNPLPHGLQQRHRVRKEKIHLDIVTISHDTGHISESIVNNELTVFARLCFAVYSFIKSDKQDCT